MSDSLTLSVYLAAGRASTRVWLHTDELDEPGLASAVQSSYDRLAKQVPWPRGRALTLHLAFSVLPGAALLHRAARAWLD